MFFARRRAGLAKTLMGQLVAKIRDVGLPADSVHARPDSFDITVTTYSRRLTRAGLVSGFRARPDLLEQSSSLTRSPGRRPRPMPRMLQAIRTRSYCCQRHSRCPTPSCDRHPEPESSGRDLPPPLSTARPVTCRHPDQLSDARRVGEDPTGTTKGGAIDLSKSSRARRS